MLRCSPPAFLVRFKISQDLRFRLAKNFHLFFFFEDTLGDQDYYLTALSAARYSTILRISSYTWQSTQMWVLVLL